VYIITLAFEPSSAGVSTPFHHGDDLHQGLLLKSNQAKDMEVPRFFEIRLVPKAASDFRTQYEKLDMEILCDQIFMCSLRY
jgi:hypothetical protein